MPPWWNRSQADDSGDSEDAGRMFVCLRCKNEVTLSIVKRVERVVNPQGAKVRIILACPCTKYVRATHYPWDDAALRRLFGGDFLLPWPTVSAVQDEPNGEAVDAATPSAQPVDDETLLRRWRWELDQCASAREFLLFCRGPRDDLAP